MPTLLTATDTFRTTIPATAIWDALATPQRWPEVLTDLREGRIDPPGELKEGALIQTFAKPATKAIDMSFRIVVAEPLRRLSFRSDGKGWRGGSDYVIAGDDHAEVTLTVSIEPLGFWPRLSVWLWHSFYQGQVSANVRVRTQSMLQLAETIARERSSA